MTSDLLLDTHAFLWWVSGSDRLPAATVDLIEGAPMVSVSLVTLWEIVLKESTPHPMVGTDDAYRWFADAMATTDFVTVPIEARHIGGVHQLPLHHRDPFDRLLVSQAFAERRTLVSRDRRLSDYEVTVEWRI